MKYVYLSAGLLFTGMYLAQTPRLSLYEEFTGEDCVPCAAYNPALNALLQKPINASKVISIKWQVPIPSAPAASWSLYKTNQTEIDWRYLAWGYGYETQNTPTSPITNGIGSAPTGRIDGQHAWTFGAQTDHPFFMNDGVIATAQAIAAPFSIAMSRAWAPSFTSVTLTVNIQATANFTATGNLVFRLVMIEKLIQFASAPGSNGETKFENAVRASFPSIQLGTPMAANWVSGQAQSFTINCVLPTHIQNKAEVAFVGFIQDDGNKKVAQAAFADAEGTVSDAKAELIVLPSVVCSNTAAPQLTVKNFGQNAITSLSITPYLNSSAGPPIQWSGYLAAGTSTTFNMNTITTAAGLHTYSCNITSVNGGADSYTGNNVQMVTFYSAPSFFAAPVTEPFTSSSFPPANWALINPDGGIYTWGHAPAVGAFGSNTGAAKYDAFSNPISSDVDDLQLPPVDLSSVNTPVLTFDLAHAQYDTGYDDGLEVLVSNDCGGSWTQVYHKVGPQLATTAPTMGAYLPSSSDWRTETVSLSAFANDPQVLVRFSAFSYGGNNIYIDNINLKDAGPTVIADFAPEAMRVKIFPNPSSDQTTLDLHAPETIGARMVVTDCLGQQIFSQELDLKKAGHTKVQVNTSHLAAGVYHIVISAKDGIVTEKLIVE